MNIVFEKERSRSAAYDGASCIGYAVIEERGGRWVIPHTEVDPAYRGQDIARRLIEEIIAAARREGRKIVPVCSYAAKMMLCQKVMCPMNKADFVAQISAAMEEFLRAHPRERFYALAFDCNTEYAEFLVGMNTEEAFQKTLMEYQEGGESCRTDASAVANLRYNPGDWMYTDIAEAELFDEDELIARYQDNMEKQCADMRRLCEEILADFRQTDTFQNIPKTADFVSYCIDHDEDPADVPARSPIE